MLTRRPDPLLAQANQLRSPCKKSVQDGINTTEVALQEIRETVVVRKGLIILARTIMRRSTTSCNFNGRRCHYETQETRAHGSGRKKTMKHKHDMRGDVHIR